MTRSLVKSLNGWWRGLPVVCQCGQRFSLELGETVKIAVADSGLAHSWFAECPQCRRNCPLVWPDGTLRTGQIPSYKSIVGQINYTPPCG